ncbi:MAG TPA: NAD(P)-dependent oxidoreductase, partial [Chloroflexota bacterium]|nr:NAD(P)-dependent oxidoreductase [Chloroflexota bacterium]
QLQQFLFASTDALYDKYVPGGMTDPIDQDVTPRRPKGWYALSKSMGEELCNGYYRTYNTPVTILRFALVVGAGEIVDFPQFYLSKLSRTHPDLAPLYKRDERLVILKDDQGRPFKKHIAEVRDIVGGCLAALGRGEALGQTFQFAGPDAFTWDRVIPYLSERLNIPSIEAETIAIPTHYEYDISKAKRLLDFQPQYDIFRMIDDALAFKRGENVGILPTQ